ncbi:hypothetical protein [Bacteriovorax sp. DB6_IX]|uniref:hypothetical protein n=1 Tax=Bacteriovorax sp. DB6_IX TaxID=1353530 RepID=UPI00038A0EC5|nr:hypothetical protein [Bacteriovorax sp. DB6_IX]EQC48116.1 hypothetical protein M901_0505 [Bacteriovorax sp. DB6_IX]
MIYNESHGTVLDLIEAAKQRIDEHVGEGSEESKLSQKAQAYEMLSLLLFSGKVSASQKTDLMNILIDVKKDQYEKQIKSIPRERDLQRLKNLILYGKETVDTSQENKSGIYNNQKVVLVSHSQGNLYANKATELLKSEFPEKIGYFGNVQLASPSNNIYHHNVAHIKLSTDYVLKLIGIAPNFYTKYYPLSKSNKNIQNWMKSDNILVSMGATLAGRIHVDQFDSLGHNAIDSYLNEQNFISTSSDGPFEFSTADYFVKMMNQVALAQDSNCDNKIEYDGDFISSHVTSSLNSQTGDVVFDFTKLVNLDISNFNIDLIDSGAITSVKSVEEGENTDGHILGLRYIASIGGTEYDLSKNPKVALQFQSTPGKPFPATNVKLRISGLYLNSYEYLSEDINFSLFVCPSGIQDRVDGCDYPETRKPSISSVELGVYPDCPEDSQGFGEFHSKCYVNYSCTDSFNRKYNMRHSTNVLKACGYRDDGSRFPIFHKQDVFVSCIGEGGHSEFEKAECF